MAQLAQPVQPSFAPPQGTPCSSLMGGGSHTEQHVGSEFRDQRRKLGPLQSECGILSTELPGNCPLLTSTVQLRGFRAGPRARTRALAAGGAGRSLMVEVLPAECVCAQSLSRDQLCATLWTIALQAPLSTGFSRKEYFPGVGCYFLLQGIFPTQESNPCLLCHLHWQVDSLPLSHLGSPPHAERCGQNK